MDMTHATPLWMWASFFGLFLALLGFDLGFLNKKDHVISIRESLRLSVIYAIIAFLFGGFIWQVDDGGTGLQEVLVLVTELHGLRGAPWGIVLGIEIQDDDLPGKCLWRELHATGRERFKIRQGFIEGWRHVDFGKYPPGQA